MERLHTLAGKSVHVKHPKISVTAKHFRTRAAQELKRLHYAVLVEKRRKLEENYISPRLSAWLCIHSHEGAWNANTGNGYHGGLQMDWSFMRAYGSEFMARWGGAENWPMWAQIRAADRAYESGRGFGPWPNTARMCGLL